MNCEIPSSKDASPRQRKLEKKFSTKSGKSFGNYGLGSSLTSFVGFKSNLQSKVAQSKIISWAAASKATKKRDNVESTMMNTAGVQNHSAKPMTIG